MFSSYLREDVKYIEHEPDETSASIQSDENLQSYNLVQNLSETFRIYVLPYAGFLSTHVELV